MAGRDPHKSPWRLARRQHGVISRTQLLALGYTRHAIEHRVRSGRLHRIHRGVFSVGRPDLTRIGCFMAAVLACGGDALLSHESAAELWELRWQRPGPIEVSIPAAASRRLRGVRLHRRRSLRPEDGAVKSQIPATSPARTIVDLATRLSGRQLEAVVNQAAVLDLITPQALRADVARMARQRGASAVRRLLDRQVFRMTDSDLERRFLRLIREAGMSTPETGVGLNGFRVDFFWPELGLVVETDGLRYHRTPEQQARDRRRDQAHAAAGMTTLRFTDAQVRYEPDRVLQILQSVSDRLTGRAAT
jgi:very-short-patch-repair endonuclease